VIKSRGREWTRHVACMAEMGNEYKISVAKSEVKRPLGRSRHRLVDNIRTDLMETG
jgi:hypothetical protein